MPGGKAQPKLPKPVLGVTGGKKGGGGKKKTPKIRKSLKGY